jgi:hypothetical protein
VNKQRILRLLREHRLLVQQNYRLKVKRTPTRSIPKLTRPNEWWGIDMTKGLVQGFGWMALVVGLVGIPRQSWGTMPAMPCRSQQWLAALDMAVNRQFPNSVRGQRLALMSDHSCQPTSTVFMQAWSNLGI